MLTCAHTLRQVNTSSMLFIRTFKTVDFCIHVFTEHFSTLVCMFMHDDDDSNDDDDDDDGDDGDSDDDDDGGGDDDDDVCKYRVD